MKDYLAFFHYEYYPQGGANDFIGAYDDLEEAKAHVLDSISESHAQCDGHVFDVTIESICWVASEHLSSINP